MVKFSSNSRLEIIDQTDFISTDPKYIEYKSHFEYIIDNKVNYDVFYYKYLERLNTLVQNNYNYIESDESFTFMKAQTTFLCINNMKFLKSKVVNIDYIIKLYLTDSYKNVDEIVRLYEQFVDKDPLIAYNIALTYQSENKCFDKMMYYYNIAIKNNILTSYFNLYTYYASRDKNLAEQYLKIGYQCRDIDCCFMMGNKYINDKAFPYLIEAYKMNNNHENTVLVLTQYYKVKHEHGKMLYFIEKCLDLKQVFVCVYLVMTDIQRIKTDNLDKINKKFYELKNVHI
jgi:tetratricopeptide (TPR) repeat protein